MHFCHSYQRLYGPDSDSQSAQTSTDYSDAFNKTVTASLGAGAVGLTTGDVSNSSLSANYDSNNTNTTVNAGANASSAGSGSGGTPSTADLSTWLPYLLLAGAVLVVLMLFKK
jgi:hypothetical protein